MFKSLLTASAIALSLYLSQAATAYTQTAVTVRKADGTIGTTWHLVCEDGTSKGHFSPALGVIHAKQKCGKHGGIVNPETIIDPKEPIKQNIITGTNFGQTFGQVKALNCPANSTLQENGTCLAGSNWSFNNRPLITAPTTIQQHQRKAIPKTFGK